MSAPNKTTRKDWIETKLAGLFTPAHLSVNDNSHHHEGHSGWREGGETHYSVDIVSAAFTGKSRVERHRMVNDALAEAFATGLHALALSARAPGEER